MILTAHYDVTDLKSEQFAQLADFLRKKIPEIVQQTAAAHGATFNEGKSVFITWSGLQRSNAYFSGNTIVILFGQEVRAHDFSSVTEDLESLIAVSLTVVVTSSIERLVHRANAFLPRSDSLKLIRTLEARAKDEPNGDEAKAIEAMKHKRIWPADE